MKLKKGLNQNKKSKEVNLMKRFLIFAMVIGISITMSASAFAGIANSKHDLSSNSSAAIRAESGVAGADQLCVWCHTPHAAVTGQGVPLWNKSITVASFTTYPTTIGGTAQVPADSIRPMSKICLTCHDGTLAINIVINAPGSGGYVATGATAGGDWVGLGATNKLNSTYGASFLDTDLSNDHPISILYSAISATTSANPASLRVTTEVSTITDAAWISRSKSDTKISGQLVGGYIECVSCHNPHSTTNQLFLRGTTAASKICTTCHDI
ncbi:MAG: cytochrome c3 family protein [Deltaproteobacteria bacterium]|nr:cytochrome c3 family protein [Deltaproteobacteria bacterium]